ncbi:hypothetical protein [Shewanella waksmanii]|uniref:hypothetical protein n=1 Tax=Shewanella waksmanii TaxID=213783 RepID=UPI00048F604D|nr:hypothetical protein [Shewanella waksmanii]
MDADKKTQKKSNLTAYLILILAGVVSTGIYFDYKSDIDRQVNVDYFRQLSEVEDSFSHTIARIAALSKYDDSKTLARQYNTYSEINLDTANGTCLFLGPPTREDASRELNGDNPKKGVSDICIRKKGEDKIDNNDEGNFQAIEINEVLSQLPNQFDEILLANNDDKIIGHSNKYSIHNISNINKLINKIYKEAEKSGISKILSSRAQPLAPTEGKISLGQTSFTDTELGGQRYRIFFHPMVYSELNQGDELVLVAILSHAKLMSRDPLSHNLPFLVSGLFLLLSIWVATLLWFYPINASLTKLTRNLSIVTLYGLLFTVLALTLSLSFKNRVKDHRHQLTVEKIKQFRLDFENDINYATANLLEQKQLFEYIWSIDDKVDCEELTAKAKKIINTNFYQKKTTSRTKKNEQLEETFNQGSCFLSSETLQFIKENVQDEDETETHSIRFIGNDLIPPNERKNHAQDGQRLDIEKIKNGLTQYNGDQPFPLSAFIANDKGITVLSIHHHEANLTSGTNLSHRNYIKQIQRGNSWSLPTNNNPQIKGEKFYLQRLYNVTNGSLGTTISVPSSFPNQVIAGDYYLPSSLLMSVDKHDSIENNQWISDLIIMISNINTGEVIFHTENERSLKENLVTLNSENSKAFATWLATSVSNEEEQLSFKGFYHGEPGRYYKTHSITGPYTVTAFLPDNSLKTLTVNQFSYLLTAITIVIAITSSLMYLFYTLYVGFRNKSRTEVVVNGIKHPFFYRLHLPTLITVWYLVVIESLQVSAAIFSITLASTLALAALYILKELKKSRSHFTDFKIESIVKHKATFSTGITLVACIIVITPTYQSSLFTFNKYQQLVHEHIMKNNTRDISKFYREYYPKTLSHCVSKQTKIPICEWFTQDITKASKPVDFTTYTQLRLLEHYVDEQLSAVVEEQAKLPPVELLGLSSLWVILSILLSASWLIIYSWWVKPRLLLSTGTRKHLTLMRRLNRSLALSELKTNQDASGSQTAKLTICLGMTKRHGESLPHALATRDDDLFRELKSAVSADQSNYQPLEQLNEHPQQANQTINYREMLPSIKYSYDAAENAMSLWDLEICLETHFTRTQLLRLIEELKQQNQVTNLTVTLHCSSSTLDKLNWLDELQLKKFETLEHRDMLAWSECLMDFDVELANELDTYYIGLDKSIAVKEQTSLPELAAIPLQLKRFYCNEKSSDLTTKFNRNLSRAHTYSYLLHHYSATYRYKWESCNDNEKLALFYLARDEQINPQNKNLISILGQKGLIELHPNGIDLKIINETFKIYVKYAESQKVFEQLKRRGSAGTWNNFKVPFTILIFMAVIGLALTSGQSIFVLLGGISAALSSIASIRTNMGNGLPK